MVRHWKEEVERHTGRGTLSDSSGHSAEVSYLLVVQQNMRERPSLNSPTEIVGGTYELSGHVVLGMAFGSIDSEGKLVLKIEDGREVEIMLTSSSDPHAWCPFVVTNSRTFAKE